MSRGSWHDSAIWLLQKTTTRTYIIVSLTKYRISWDNKPCSINSFALFTEVQPQGSLCFISDEKSFSGLLTVDTTLPRIYHQTFPTHQEIERTVLQPGGGAGSPYRPGSAARRLRVCSQPRQFFYHWVLIRYQYFKRLHVRSVQFSL